MRRIALLVLLLFTVALSYAGIDDFYSFTTTTGTYTPITGTAIEVIQTDDELSPAIPIGFSFPYGDNNYANVMVSSNGWVGLGSTFTSNNLSNALTSTGTMPVLAPLWDDLSLVAGTAMYLSSGTAPNRIFTMQYSAVKWNYSGDNSFNFQVKMYENGKVEFCYGSFTGTPNSPSASIGINMSPGNTNWFYSYTPGVGVSTTVENGNISTIPASGTVLQFIPAVATPNDLAAQSITGNLTPTAGTASNYTVTVRNRGTSPQSNYTVTIVNSAGTTLASVAGTLIQPNAVQAFTIPWNPTVEGPVMIYGKVNLASDGNPANNQSAGLNITVMPAGVIAVTVGSGDQLDNIPVDMYWMNSLFETMYYPTEITMLGNITSLTFYNNFVTSLPNKPTKIWLGTTTQADLSAGWIPSTQLTLVYNGNVNYPVGQNNITIPLQNLYTYTGGNLVMMVNRPLDVQYFSSSDKFLSQTVGPNRSRKVQADGTTFDPATPPTDATLSGSFPKTTFTITPMGTTPILFTSPSSKNFGSVLMNSTNNQTFTLVNGGGGTLTISSVSISGSPFFTIQNPPTLPASLNTGQSITFVGRYLPTAPGTHNATITIADNRQRLTSTIALSGICVDPTIYTLPQLQTFDNVVAPALPIEWQKYEVVTTQNAYVKTVTNAPFSTPNCVEMASGSDFAATLILIAPPYANTINTNTTRVNLRAKATQAGTTLSIGVMTNPLDAATFQLVQSLPLTSTWTQHIVSLAAYTGTGRYVAFKHGMTASYQTIDLDNIMLEVIPQNDLACLTLTGNSTPSVGTLTTYTTSVYNWGTVTQANYQVKLYNSNNIELASVPGTSIAPAATVQIPLSWTPTVQGATSIYAKVILTGDQNPINDNSPVLPVTVMPEGMMTVTIGNGDIMARMPVDMFWKNSLFETLYYPEEIGAYGHISSLSFYNNFITDLPNKPTKIWLGSTTQADLSGGWIPSTQLTLVYDGNVNYPSGANTISIPLQIPYSYGGGNLVMMVNRPMDTQYFSSSDNFLAQTVGTNRSRNIQSDGTQYDPAAPPPEAPLSGIFPKTTLHMTPLSPNPIFMVSPASKNYGTVLLNTTHNQTFTVMNVGGGTLTINSISIAGDTQFTIQNIPTLPANLNTGQSISFVGRYIPTAVGTPTATITINDNLTTRSGLRSNPNRTAHTVALTGTCIDPTITALPYTQNFDAVIAPTLPITWSKSVTPANSVASIATTNSGAFSAPNCVFTNSGNDATASMILIAPPLANNIATNTVRTKFRAHLISDNTTLVVGVMTDPQNAASFTAVQTITPNVLWTEHIISLAAYTGTGKYIAFKHTATGAYQGIFLDDIAFEPIPQNDLAALQLSGNVTPSIDMASNYTVSIYNWGTVAQSNYTVKLFKTGDIEVSSVPGPAINPAQTMQVTVPWAPTTAGPTSIYAKVVLAGDQIPTNDTSNSLNIEVQSAGIYVLTIGVGDQTARKPVDMYFMNSLFETLYYPAELGNTIGTFTALGFYNNFVTDLPARPTKIWMGTTTNADLSAGWIPSTELTLVFDGNVNYPAGQNLINIPLQTPYLYLNGQNVVVMVQRPMDTSYYSSSDVFYCQTGTELRARNAYSDGTGFDPASPPDATASGQFPKTSFFIIPGGVGHLNGTILGIGNQPLPDVNIQFATGGYSTTTNAQGQYNIQNILHETYQVSFSHHGYITNNQTVVIPEDETVVLNLTMLQMPIVNVTGTIFASNTGAGLAGAGIHLAGYDNYNVTTNAAGTFSIPEVYANNAYNYTIICPGYQNATGIINVGATNYSMGTMTLNEIAYAPGHVLAEITNNTSVNVTWQAPDPTTLELSEDFEAVSFPPQSWNQTVTNIGPMNTAGVYPTWCGFGTVNIDGDPAVPTSGIRQAGLWWSYDHQDEWLITPQFNCPPSAYLTFDTYATLGSTNGDHYYVKISTTEGQNWTVLWDASAQTAGTNYYASPISVDLSLYEGMPVKLAWHAVDPPTNDGLWNVWCIDNIYIGNAVTTVRFADSFTTRSGASRSALPLAMIPTTNPSRAVELGIARSKPRHNYAQPFIGKQIGDNPQRTINYKVWRLIAGQESEENMWTLLTPTAQANLNLSDNNWSTLADGTYRWAVKAVYTGNVLSVPSFSNPVVKEILIGSIAGVCRNPQNQPVPGVTITAGTYTATTTSSGAYNLSLPVGTYTVRAAKNGYLSVVTPSVIVNASAVTTLNFTMVPGVGNDDQVIPIVATELNGNYPNPFNPETTISYAIKDRTHVRLEIYNTKGQLIRILVNQEQPTGRYDIVWNGRDNNNTTVSSGMYIYRMNAGSYVCTRKMLLMQ
ncbi:MAG: hypothetical protein CVU48_00615 [Candidatus Cloacimonetes bacterium HGW-Cloacimonetes-1]|nr:MAG: hypothetical protein CVU48_00615 [Candidatus Cloacimonetes bacterium HGW-Cloacimonetes-1]